MHHAEPDVPSPQPLLTVAETVIDLRISRRHSAGLVGGRGAIPSIVIGRYRRIRRADLQIVNGVRA